MESKKENIRRRLKQKINKLKERKDQLTMYDKELSPPHCFTTTVGSVTTKPSHYIEAVIFRL
jgi:hypothetical protein